MIKTIGYEISDASKQQKPRKFGAFVPGAGIEPALALRRTGF